MSSLILRQDKHLNSHHIFEVDERTILKSVKKKVFVEKNETILVNSNDL